MKKSKMKEESRETRNWKELELKWVLWKFKFYLKSKNSKFKIEYFVKLFQFYKFFEK